MFKQRFITGSILAIVAISIVVFFSTVYFIAAMSILTLFAAWEWGKLVDYKTKITRLLYVVLIAAAMGFAWYSPVLPILIASLCWWLLALCWVLRYPKDESVFANEKFIRSVMGILVLVPTWLALSLLRTTENHVALLMLLLCIVWASDVGAYLSGKTWGRRLLLPNVSPKKTWEGLFGGVMFSLFIVFAFCMMLRIDPMHWPFLLLLGMLVSLFGVLGDLLESMLKRCVNLKNSGDYLPGHGGILDRIDSLTAAAPMFLLGFMVFRGLLHI